MPQSRPSADAIPDRTESGHPLNRRVVLQASAGIGAMITAGAVLPITNPPPRHAYAQEAEGTRARTWDEGDSIDTGIKLEGEGWVTLHTDFPFWALGFAWDAAVGTWPAVEYAISSDGQLWDEGYSLTAHSDGGPAPRDDRHHTELFFADGQEYIRYRTVDGEGNLVVLDRFQVTYIDPTDGPWAPDRGATMMRTAAVNTDTLVPPTIISRAQWGANESIRFDSSGEIWPSEYQTVEHAIVHHAAANYGSDGYNAVRSIYYYHCVTQGWGDIGYNYVVDVNGNIFEGRVGGANVIGGHAYEYANGSSGICVMGDFSSTDAPAASKTALANIIAYVVRDLNPLGTSAFHAAPALPTICAHRDVNQSSCPGNGLYDDLPWIRNTVKSILDSGKLDSQKPGGIVPGDWVRIQTENNTALPMRSQPGMNQLVIDNIPYNRLVEVERGPLADSQYNWYLVHYNNKLGWVPATYLLVDPPMDEPIDGYSYGQNLRMTATTTLRSTPNGGSLGSVASGSWAFIMAGPLTAGGVAWFQIRTQSNGDGWVPRSTITLAPVYNPTPRFPVGSNVITTVSAPMRVRPGIAQTTDGMVAAGRTLQISVAPIAVTGRTWYGVYGGTGIGGGWIEEGQLKAGSNAIIVVGNVTASGQQFRTTDSVNMRTGPGTGYSTVTTLGMGVMGSVIGGPQSANGYQWWQVRTDANQQGWVVNNYIQQIKTGTTGNLTGFGVGVTIRTNTSVNLRSDAGTGYSVVATLASNTNGTIIDGPRISTGYTWWRIRTVSGQVGWVAQTYLVRTSGLPPKFKAGDSVRAIKKAMRKLRGTDKTTTLAPMPANMYAIILSGPVDAYNHRWWNVHYGSEVGWVPEVSLEHATKFRAGSSVKSQSKVIMYTKLGDTATVTAMPAAKYAAIIAGPSVFAHRLWYRVNYESTTGWVPQDWLEAGNKFKVGASARQETKVMLYGTLGVASTASAMPAQSYVTILAGPSYYGNRLWYRVRDGSLIGWIPQDWMVSANKFGAGSSVLNTPKATMYGTLGDTSTMSVFPANTYAVILEGPRSYGARLWYRTRNRNILGWVPQDSMTRAIKFSEGDAVTASRVQSWGTLGDASTAGVLAEGTRCTVVSGPTYYGGRLYYRVRTDTDVLVWAPQDWLT